MDSNSNIVEESLDDECTATVKRACGNAGDGDHDEEDELDEEDDVDDDYFLTEFDDVSELALKAKASQKLHWEQGIYNLNSLDFDKEKLLNFWMV